ncbi:hypothetical protein GCM10028774_10060 [Spirosoma jeollabukense]
MASYVRAALASPLIFMSWYRLTIKVQNSVIYTVLIRPHFDNKIIAKQLDNIFIVNIFDKISIVK